MLLRLGKYETGSKEFDGGGGGRYEKMDKTSHRDRRILELHLHDVAEQLLCFCFHIPPTPFTAHHIYIYVLGVWPVNIHRFHVAVPNRFGWADQGSGLIFNKPRQGTLPSRPHSLIPTYQILPLPHSFYIKISPLSTQTQEIQSLTFRFPLWFLLPFSPSSLSSW